MKQIELTSKLVLAIIGLVSVGALLIPTYAVPTIKSVDIFDGEVKTADLANGAVTNPKLATDAVTTTKIKDGEVTSADIKDATITSTDIAPGTIPSGGGGTLEVTERFSDSQPISPGSNQQVQAICLDGEVPTGGGFGISGHDVVVMGSNRDVSTNGWEVNAFNPATATEDGTVTATVECAKLVP